MTAATANAAIADVERTIRYWRTRGVIVADIAPQLRCHGSWAAVRAAMVTIALAGDPPQQQAA
jgi:hypothetical protein